MRERKSIWCRSRDDLGQSVRELLGLPKSGYNEMKSLASMISLFLTYISSNTRYSAHPFCDIVRSVNVEDFYFHYNIFFTN